MTTKRMTLKKIYQRLHDTSSKLGQTASLASAVAVIAGNSTLVGLPIWIIGSTKAITGAKVADEAMIQLAHYWIGINNRLIDTVLPKRDWRIEMPDDLSQDKQYLLISNHLSWVDTSIVQYISEGRLPLTRFFTKFSLIYIPFIGQAFYFLDFPMIKRPPKSKKMADAKLREANMLEAKRACKLLENKPFALLNYLEGTRFTPEKREQQNAPYQHLLKPRAGGISLAIEALGQQIDGILDMTIVYPDGNPSYGDLWRGNVKRLGVHVRRIEVPQTLFNAIEAGNYHDNDDMKKIMYAWLDDIWQYKDAQISRMLADFNSEPAPL